MYFFGKAGKSGFGYRSSAEDVSKDVDATGLTALVTGGTGGLGLETARVLALRGAHVYITGRSEKSASEAKETILKSVPNAKVDLLAPFDLESQATIRDRVKEFLAKDVPLNILVNNAGIMMCPYGLTKDGIERQIGTNHVGHFLLTSLLLDKLKETANSSGKESRIVILSSAAITWAPKTGFPWETLNDEKGYSKYGYYGLSKLANIYHAQELTRRLKEEGVENVTANALHPGGIKTGLVRHTALLSGALFAVTGPLWKTIPQGSATSVYVALHPSLKGVSGKFFADANEEPLTTYTKIGEDKEAAKKLWQVSEEYIAKSA